MLTHNTTKDSGCRTAIVWQRELGLGFKNERQEQENLIRLLDF